MTGTRAPHQGIAHPRRGALGGGRAPAAERHAVPTKHGRPIRVAAIGRRRNVTARMGWPNEPPPDSPQLHPAYGFLPKP